MSDEPNLVDGYPKLADAAAALIRGHLDGLAAWAVQMVRDHINAAFREGYQVGYNDCLRDKAKT